MKPAREESKGFDLAAIFGGKSKSKEKPKDDYASSDSEMDDEESDDGSSREEVRMHLETLLGEVDDDGVDAFVAACKAARDC